MPSWGAHVYLWASSPTSTELERAIGAASALGLDHVQISLTSLDSLDAAVVRGALLRHRMACTTGLALPKGVWVDRRRGGMVAFLRRAVDTTAALGATMLCGALYTPLGLRTVPASRRQELAIVRLVLKEVAQYARVSGVQLCLEPVNRYETSLVNTCAQAVELVTDIDEQNVSVQLDTFHMNIEEQDFYASILQTGERIGYVQLADSHRGAPGDGHIPWDAVFAGLRDVGYDGGLALESFTSRNRAVTMATSVWRDVVGDPDKFVSRSMRYLLARARAVGYLA
jgi:D-psicose/D-tagatose/L-ribulose 3-epimerase